MNYSSSICENRQGGKLIIIQNNSVAMDAEQKKKRTFKKFTYRGVDLDKLLDMSPKDLMELVDVSGCLCVSGK